MKQSELRNIIKEEINKMLNEVEKEYEVSYFYIKNDEDVDDDITVKAKNEVEAIEKAKKQAKRSAKLSSFTAKEKK